ncbi:MAG: hypothetical protein JOY58_14470, partial [Solirubrobacterales bacterium]|nr:hypothetical protein [Solirubrobacterales bacterium]
MSNQPLATDTPPVTPPVGRANGFELNVPRQIGESGLDLALECNRAFATAGGHEGALV